MENLQEQGRAAQPPWGGAPPERGEEAAAQRARGGRRANGPAGPTQLGTVLAGLSLAIGVAALLAPRAAARASGMPNWPWLMRAIGLRELACGFGLLAQPASPVWRWTRVAGDAMDMTLLGAAAFAPSSSRGRLLAAAAIAGGITALDVRASTPVLNRPSSQPLPGQKGARRVQKTVAVNRPPAECYAFWRQFERFPSFMQHVESIAVLDERRSHWRVKAPLGARVEFDARITEERPGELIAWRSEEGAEVEHAGQVSFTPAPGGRGTIVQLQMDYRPPAGRAGAVVAKLFGEEPAQQAADDLRRFKQLIETGEIPTTRGQSHGMRSLKASLFNLGVEQ